jgi:hypothetical protein
MKKLIKEVLIMERLKNDITSAEFWKAAGIRALKTFCQTAIAAIGTTALIEQVNWLVVGSASLLAAVLSILTSIATGLPEV